nr:hypothetical protein [Tanacetum cinerariifolium]
MTSFHFLLLYGATTVAVVKTGLAVGTTSLPVGTDPLAEVLAVGMDPLLVGTSTTLLAKTVAASIEVRIVLKFAKIAKIQTISTQDQKPQRKARSGSKFSLNNLTMKLNLSKFQSLGTISA